MMQLTITVNGLSHKVFDYRQIELFDEYPISSEESEKAKQRTNTQLGHDIAFRNSLEAGQSDVEQLISIS